MDIWVICCGVKPQQSLQDIIELRARNWLPRKDITSCENLKVADDKTEDQIDEFCTRFFRVRDLRESQAGFSKFHITCQPHIIDKLVSRAIGSNSFIWLKCSPALVNVFS
jgi:hypothetical protein